MKNMISSISDLIAINTVSDISNQQGAAWVANRLNSLNFQVDELTYNFNGIPKYQILATQGPSLSNGKGLIISGHLDTVPFDSQPGWCSDPLKLVEQDDLLIGRGTTDMKSFIVIVIETLKELSLNQLKAPLTLLFTSDEEVCCRGSSKLKELLSSQQIASLPHHALIGEPTNFNVFHAHKGILVFDIIIHGKPGHSSRPDLGDNAIESMAKTIECIQSVNQTLRQHVSSTSKDLYPEFPFPHLNMGRIDGGVAKNMIPEKCSIEVCGRTTHDILGDEILDLLKTKLKTKKISFTIDNTDSVPPLLSSPHSEFFKFLKESNSVSKNHGAPYATDGGFISQLGIDSYICGPGTLNQAHQPNESLPINHIPKTKLLVKKSIEQMCM